MSYAIMVLILICTCFYGVERIDDSNKWLTKSECLPLRGIACISILVGHSWTGLAATFLQVYLYSLYRSIGYLWVGYFFFLSGFGLTNSYISNFQRRKNYIIRKVGGYCFRIGLLICFILLQIFI